METVLVTGGHGFLGRHVVERLKGRVARRDEFGLSLECCAKYRNKDGYFLYCPCHEHYDLTSLEDVCHLLGQTGPEVVVHLAAACGGIGANLACPAQFLHDNAAMALNIFDRTDAYIVAAGSVCAYPARSAVPFREEDLWDGPPEETNAAYGVAKRLLVSLSRAYRRQYGQRSCVLMLANMYGPGDKIGEGGHVVADLVRKFRHAPTSGTVTLWGTGEATRDFLFVEDAAEAVKLAVEKRPDCEAINIGSGREVSIAELAEFVARCIGFRGRINWDGTMPDGQRRRCVSTERARSLLGFEPTVMIEEGVERTVKWFREKST